MERRETQVEQHSKSKEERQGQNVDVSTTGSAQVESRIVMLNVVSFSHCKKRITDILEKPLVPFR